MEKSHVDEKLDQGHDVMTLRLSSLSLALQRLVVLLQQIAKPLCHHLQTQENKQQLRTSRMMA